MGPRQIEAGRAVVRTVFDQRSIDQGVSALQQRFQRVGRNLVLGGGGGLAFGVGLQRSLGRAAEQAGDFEETLNRFNAVFGNQSRASQDFANQFARDANRFEGDVLNSLSTYQSFLIGLGQTPSVASGVSREITQLAEDFGSFNNLSSEEANQRFISGLSGSAEVFDRFGINLRASALDQEFLRQGMEVTNRTATEQQKVFARLSIIRRVLGSQGAIGDAIRTSDSFVNSQRGVRASLRSFQVEVGRAVIPLRRELNTELIRYVRIATDFVSQNPEVVRQISFVGTAAIVAGSALVGIGTALVAGSALFNLFAGSAANAAGATFAVGNVAAGIGGIFSRLGGILASPFVVLTNAARGAIGVIGNVGLSVLSILNPFSLLRGIIFTVIPALVSAAIAVGGFVSAVGFIPIAIGAAVLAFTVLIARNEGFQSLAASAQDILTIFTALTPIIAGSISVLARLATILNDNIIRPAVGFVQAGIATAAAVADGSFFTFEGAAVLGRRVADEVGQGLSQVSVPTSFLDIGTILGDAAGDGADIRSRSREIFEGVTGDISELVGSVDVNQLRDGAVGVFEDIRDAAEEIFPGVGDQIAGLVGEAGNIGTNIFDQLSNLDIPIPEGFDSIEGAAEALQERIQGLQGNAGGVIQSVTDSITSALQNQEGLTAQAVAALEQAQANLRGLLGLGGQQEEEQQQQGENPFRDEFGNRRTRRETGRILQERRQREQQAIREQRERELERLAEARALGAIGRNQARQIRNTGVLAGRGFQGGQREERQRNDQLARMTEENTRKQLNTLARVERFIEQSLGVNTDQLRIWRGLQRG